MAIANFLWHLGDDDFSQAMDRNLDPQTKSTHLKGELSYVCDR